MKLKSFSLVLFLFVSLSVYPVSSEKPLWISYQEGIKFFKEHKFSDAMAVFKTCTLENPTYPEAEYWIGKIFEIEGEFELAKRQYLKALEPSSLNALNIADFEFTIRSALAGVYEKTGESNLQINEILTIINKDSWYSSTKGKQDLNAIYKLWLDKGINRVFELYRIQNRRFSDYYAMAGEFYYYNGRIEEAIKMLSVSALSIFSELAEIQKKMHPDFIFTNKENFEKRYLDTSIPKELYELHLYDIADLVKLSMVDPEIGLYLEKANFFKTIYYLGLSLAEVKHYEHAFDMLIICSSYSSAGHYQNLALKKMQSLLIIN